MSGGDFHIGSDSVWWTNLLASKAVLLPKLNITWRHSQHPFRQPDPPFLKPGARARVYVQRAVRGWAAHARQIPVGRDGCGGGRSRIE
jgi:hypothetical protein